MWFGLRLAASLLRWYDRKVARSGIQKAAWAAPQGCGTRFRHMDGPLNDNHSPSEGEICPNADMCRPWARPPVLRVDIRVHRSAWRALGCQSLLPGVALNRGEDITCTNTSSDPINCQASGVLSRH